MMARSVRLARSGSSFIKGIPSEMASCMDMIKCLIWPYRLIRHLLSMILGAHGVKGERSECYLPLTRVVPWLAERR